MSSSNGPVKARFDKFAVGAYRLDQRLTRANLRGSWMPYMPLVVLGLPFGAVGVYVMLAVSAAVMFALPGYGKRVARSLPAPTKSPARKSKRARRPAERGIVVLITAVTPGSGGITVEGSVTEGPLRVGDTFDRAYQASTEADMSLSFTVRGLTLKGNAILEAQYGDTCTIELEETSAEPLAADDILLGEMRD